MGCDVMKGWACNSATPSDPLWLEFYMDELTAPGGYLGWSGLANGETTAPDTVKAACGGTSAHEFTFTMPKNSIFASWPVRDGLPHQIYIAGKQSSNGSGWYMFPTQTITCSQE